MAVSQLKIEDGTFCAICFEEYKKDEDLVQLECSKYHIYHLDCIKAWI